MSRNAFHDDDRSFQQQRNAMVVAVVVAIAFLIAFIWMTYNMFIVDVPTGHIAVVIQKTGKDLKNSDIVAPSEEYKGVQAKIRTEGRYFRNPYLTDWEIFPHLIIPRGELAVLVSLTGDDLPYGEFLAKKDADGNWTKGIVPDVLKAGGRHMIHPYMFDTETHKPVTIQAGLKGVVTNLAGRLPKNSNSLLVEEGERGVQRTTYDPGTYYVNPYMTRIEQIDCRSQRFNLSSNQDMGFPSKDGFWISLDGVIEFRVHPDRAAEVYVTYNDKQIDNSAASLGEEIIRKVIMPNARSFCRMEGSNKSGREFIQGKTRSQFQHDFEKDMRASCEPKGVEIIQALITRIRPPEQIAKPVRDREIAKQQEKQFQQQILQQESEKKLAIEQQLVKQKPALVQADQDVVKLTTDAKRKQEVAVTKGNERLAVAGFRLDAAKDEAAAIMERGTADAKVVNFQNEAEAAGWKRAVEAFSGNGNEYARYVMFQKLAGAYRRIMVNTADSPIMKVFETFAPTPTSPRPLPPTRSAEMDETRSLPTLGAAQTSDPQ